MLGRLMEAEICEQPAMLAANSSRYYEELRAALAGHEIEMIVLAARGSSDHAAIYARYLFEIFLGIPVSLAAPSVVTRYGARMRYKKCLGIGISQSGAAPDVAEVLALLKAQGHATVAITNTAGSLVTKAAGASLVLGVGEEKSLPATKTYTASLLAAYQLARAHDSKLPDPAGHLPDYEWMEESRVEAERGVQIVLTHEPLFSLGRGFEFATALEQALKLMECALLSCKGYSTADFEHGPKALAGPTSASIVFGDPPPGLQSTRVQCPTAPPDVPEPLTTIWEAIFAQWLALAAARAKGHDPDTPPNISKVTQTL